MGHRPGDPRLQLPAGQGRLGARHRDHPRSRGPHRRPALSARQGRARRHPRLRHAAWPARSSKAELAEHQLLDRAVIHQHDPGDRVRIGPFEVEFLAITHSIPDGVGLSIETPVGPHHPYRRFQDRLHAGARRRPRSQPPGPAGSRGRAGPAQRFDRRRARRLYAFRAGRSSPEFDRIFRDAPGRIIVATFASLLSRVQQVVNAAQRHGRVVALAGYSMFKTAEIGRRPGPPGRPARRAGRPVRDQAHARQPRGDRHHRQPGPARSRPGPHGRRHPPPDRHQARATPSSSRPTPYPATRKRWRGSSTSCLRAGANVIYPPLATVHVSGHASQEELKLMLSLTRPRFFVPIHGELRHLHAHARLARQLGIPDDRIFIMENGSVLELSRDSAASGGTTAEPECLCRRVGRGRHRACRHARARDAGPRRLCDCRRARQPGHAAR